MIEAGAQTTRRFTALFTNDNKLMQSPSLQDIYWSKIMVNYDLKMQDGLQVRPTYNPEHSKGKAAKADGKPVNSNELASP